MADPFDPADVYRPPVALGDAPSLPAQRASSYVVSVGKLTVLFVATLGIYQIHWFYKHWQRYRAVTGENIRPVWRAIFSIFFVHKLFASISARGSGPEAANWSHAKLANIFVVLTIVSVVLSRISSQTDEFGLLDFLGMVVGMLTVVPMRTAQRIANVSSGDPDGTGNARYGAGAIVAILIGLFLWLMIAGVLVMQTALPNS